MVRRSRQSIIRYIKIGLLVEAVVVSLILFNLTPHWPRTLFGWLLVIVIGPPLWFLGEGLLEWVTGMGPYDFVTSVVFWAVVLLLLVGSYFLLSMLLGDLLRPHFY